MRDEIKNKNPDKTNWEAIEIEFEQHELDALNSMAAERGVDIDVMVNHILEQAMLSEKLNQPVNYSNTLKEIDVSNLAYDQHIKSSRK